LRPVERRKVREARRRNLPWGHSLQRAQSGFQPTSKDSRRQPYRRIAASPYCRPNYKKAILVAGAEVNNAIANFRAARQRLKDLQTALAESRRTVDLALERYDRGLTDFLNVLDAQRQQFELEQQSVRRPSRGMDWVGILPRDPTPEPGIALAWHSPQFETPRR
jgi:hypothetical protein